MMLLLYFKTDKASSFRDQRLSLEVIFCGLVKSTNPKYLDLQAKNEKSETTLFSETLKVPEIKVL